MISVTSNPLPFRLESQDFHFHREKGVAPWFRGGGSTGRCAEQFGLVGPFGRRTSWPRSSLHQSDLRAAELHHIVARGFHGVCD